MSKADYSTDDATTQPGQPPTAEAAHGGPAPGVQSGVTASDFSAIAITRYCWAADDQGRASNLQAVLDEIAACDHQEGIDSLRAITDEDEYREAKKLLPAATFSGTFSHRAIKGLTNHSQIVVLDIDHLRDLAQSEQFKDRLKDHPAIIAIFVSPGGHGIKVLIACAAPEDVKNADTKWWGRKHRDFWQSAINTLPPDMQRLVDPSGKDVCRLCFLSADAVMLIAPADKDFEPVRLTSQARVNVPPPPDRPGDPAEDFALDTAALEYIQPPDEYTEWLSWLATLKKLGFSEAEADAWSTRGSKYQPGELRLRWDSLLDGPMGQSSVDEERNKLRGHAYNQGWRAPAPEDVLSGDNGKDTNKAGEIRDKYDGRKKMSIGEDLAREAEIIGEAIVEANALDPWQFSIDNDVLVRFVGSTVAATKP